MAYFPLYIDVGDKKCAVVGGGRIAQGKVSQLLLFGASVAVIAPEVTEELARMAESGRIGWVRRAVTEDRLEELLCAGGEPLVVVAATDRAEVNRAVSAWCKSRRIPVNVVDERELCSFFFPAVIKDGDVVVSVSTGGTSPALAARIRRRIQGELPPGYGDAAKAMGEWREYVRRRTPPGEVRKRVFETMLDQLLAKGSLSEGEVDRMIEEQPAAVPGHIRIGTRGSRLALAQTELFIRRLRGVYPKVTCETVVLRTAGDRIADRPLSEFGGKAVFVTEFEEAILSGRIDCAVHSAKDMPAELPDGLEIVCVLPREDVRDVLVTRAGRRLRKTEAAVIGTGSLRRKVQLLALYPDATVKQLRGNITTRLERLKSGEYDGIILAAAGLRRLGLDGDEELEYTYFDVDDMTPAGGQALIAVEGRAGGQEYLRPVTDARSEAELLAEREVLRLLGAGCHEAVGVYARLDGEREERGKACSCDVWKAEERGKARSCDAGKTEERGRTCPCDAGKAEERGHGAAAGSTRAEPDSAHAGSTHAEPDSLHMPETHAEPGGAVRPDAGPGPPETMRISLMKEENGVIRRREGSAPAAEWRALASALAGDFHGDF